MDNLINEYPKAIASFVIGALVTYLAGKVPEDLLSPPMVQSAQVIVATIAFTVFGKYIRLTKTEAETLKGEENLLDKNQLN